MQALLRDPWVDRVARRRRLATGRSRRPPAGSTSTAWRRASGDRVDLVAGRADLPRPPLREFDAAAVVEVVEHLDPPRLRRLRAGACSATPGPPRVVVTTPNVEYNARFEGLPAGTPSPPRPPLRVDAGRVRGLGRDGVAAAHGYAVTYRASARRPRGRPARRRWRCSADEPPRSPSPTCALVVLVGVSGSGKSTFAARHFLPTEVISSDFCRGLVGRRRERPDAPPRPPSRSCTTSPASGWRPAG